jgi:hypothetical protein
MLVLNGQGQVVSRAKQPNLGGGNNGPGGTAGASSFLNAAGTMAG